ncbi:hypothetical protein RJ639_003342 [Escallonia herrerae]|uniref:Uncharacterized protein n=1 Tax=Escallonia herrerae TaxID=1293975 RepID=A0AA89AWT5_9ASTE|nr:hypothetical protein RJ639_003342 [Escallonia herrerae]
MASRYGSLSRSLISTARASAVRSAPSLPRLRPPPALGSGLNSRRLLTTANIGLTLQPPLLRTIGGVIGCTQSLLPLHSVVAASRLTSHIAVEVRACCELSQGTFFCRTCPDR